MKAIHFKSLFSSFFISFLLGIMYTFICVLCSNDVLGTDSGIHLLLGSVISFFISLGINAVVLPVISLTDRKAMDEMHFMQLMQRYLPLFALPFACIYLCFLFTENVQEMAVIYVFIVMLVVYTNLCLYIRFLKSSSVNSQNHFISNELL